MLNLSRPTDRTMVLFSCRECLWLFLLIVKLYSLKSDRETMSVVFVEYYCLHTHTIYMSITFTTVHYVHMSINTYHVWNA